MNLAPLHIEQLIKLLDRFVTAYEKEVKVKQATQKRVEAAYEQTLTRQNDQTFQK